MSERDLVRELKENIKELTQDRDDALAKCKTKESRMRQIMIKLEHATNDVQSMGHKICLLYTSPSPRDRTRSRMPSSA